MRTSVRARAEEMMSWSRRAFAIPLGAALLLLAAVPIFAQTPGPSPTPVPGTTGTPQPRGGPGLAFPTLTPSPAPTPNPVTPYSSFLLAAGAQQSDLPPGNIFTSQLAAGGADIDLFSAIGVTPVVAFLQIAAPIDSPLAAASSLLGTGTPPLADALFVFDGEGDAHGVMTLLSRDPSPLVSDTSAQNVAYVQPAPALGDEALEVQGTERGDDPATGQETTLMFTIVAARYGRVVVIVEAEGTTGQQQAAEALAAAIGARVQAALPLLPGA
jgi:hypothetical protein